MQDESGHILQPQARGALPRERKNRVRSLFPTSPISSSPGNESSQSTSIYGCPQDRWPGGDVGCWKRPRAGFAQTAKGNVNPRLGLSGRPGWVYSGPTPRCWLGCLLSGRPEWVDRRVHEHFGKTVSAVLMIGRFGRGRGWRRASSSPSSRGALQQSESVPRMLSDVHHFLLRKCKCG